MPRTASGIVLPSSHLPSLRRSAGKPRRSLTMGIGALMSPEGDVLWQDPDWMLNALDDEGEQDMLSVYLAQSTHLTKYAALINGTTTAPTETSTMAYLGGAAGANETQVPAANGYNRQQILNTDWVSDGLIGGDYRSSAAEKTFGPAATVSWTANNAGLVTAATGQLAGSGKFLLHIALSATTTVAIGQSFKYILRWTQQ